MNQETMAAIAIDAADRPLPAGGTSPRAVARDHDAFRELMQLMHQNRVKRPEHAGFTPEQAQTLSELHTPKFM